MRRKVILSLKLVDRESECFGDQIAAGETNIRGVSEHPTNLIWSRDAQFFNGRGPDCIASKLDP